MNDVLKFDYRMTWSSHILKKKYHKNMMNSSWDIKGSSEYYSHRCEHPVRKGYEIQLWEPLIRSNTHWLFTLHGQWRHKTYVNVPRQTEMPTRTIYGNPMVSELVSPVILLALSYTRMLRKWFWSGALQSHSQINFD